MKKTALFLTLSFLAMTSLAQQDMFIRVIHKKAAQTYMGVNVSEVYTGSGHGYAYVMRTNLQRGRRYLSVGAVLDDNAARLSGADVKFKVYLGDKGNPETLNTKKTHIVPYLHYSCLYHTERVVGQDVHPTSKKSDNIELPAGEGRVATIEHFLGLGLQMNLASSFYVDGNLGLGIYIGSLDHFQAPRTFGIHMDNYGFVLAAELGVGYSFSL